MNNINDSNRVERERPFIIEYLVDSEFRQEINGTKLTKKNENTIIKQVKRMNLNFCDWYSFFCKI